MPILVLHVPTWRAKAENARSFEDTFKSGIGDGYAIASTELPLITPGCVVWLLDKGGKKRAEGTLARLEHEDCTNSGIPRYNVHIANLRIVPYQHVKLNKRGIAII